MPKISAFAVVVALLLSARAGYPCSQAKLPPVDIELFEAALQRELLSSLDDTGGTWTELGPMPVSNSEFSVALVDRRFYAVGGFRSANQDKLLIYDPATDSWTDGASLPQRSHHSGVVAVGGKVYALGGTRAESLVQIYDPAADSWSLGSEMPTPRTAPAAMVLDGRIHVVGGAGSINRGDAMAAHEVYDPASDRWETRADIPEASEHVFGQAIDGRLYVAGGRNGFANTTSVWVYDPAGDSWSPAASLLTPTSGYAPGLARGKMYAFGGEDILSSTVTGRTQIYDPAADSWEALEPMPVPLHGVAGGSLDGSLYVFGGARVAASGNGSSLVFRFDPPGAGDRGEVPKKPKRLKAKALSPTEVRLKWKDKSKDESSFEIEMSVDGGPFREILATSANTRRQVVSGLAPATTYAFRVRARNEAGASSYSNERTVTTPAS